MSPTVVFAAFAQVGFEGAPWVSQRAVDRRMAWHKRMWPASHQQQLHVCRFADKPKPSEVPVKPVQQSPQRASHASHRRQSKAAPPDIPSHALSSLSAESVTYPLLRSPTTLYAWSCLQTPAKSPTSPRSTHPPRYRLFSTSPASPPCGCCIRAPPPAALLARSAPCTRVPRGGGDGGLEAAAHRRL